MTLFDLNGIKPKKARKPKVDLQTGNLINDGKSDGSRKIDVEQTIDAYPQNTEELTKVRINSIKNPPINKGLINLSGEKGERCFDFQNSNFRYYK